MMTEDPILDAKLRGDQEKRRMVEDAGGTLGALCAVLFIPFWVGMIWDCLFQSKLSLLSKALWLAFIVPTVYLGMLVYFFVVYEKRVPRGCY